MKFAEYVKLFEAAPGMPAMGIGAPTSPFGGPPGMAPSPLGVGMGAPMPPGGMGAMPPGAGPLDPTGMGGDPNAPPPTPATNIKVKDVWSVLEKVLSQKSKNQKSDKQPQRPVF